jgi:hypothetical protein
MEGLLVNMVVHARRFAILLAALSTLSVTLVACQVTGTGSGAGSDTNSAFTFTTPNPKSQSPTPAFPVFTIGAWPSTYSPQALDNITIYVLCRVQNPSMTGPASPPPGPLTVTVQVKDPINKVLTGKTDATGLAAIPLSFTDPTPGTPVQVTVYANYQNKSYYNQTFFTPGATYTPTPKSSPTPNGSPTVTATP